MLVILPTLALSEMSDEEYCRMRFGVLEINTFDIFGTNKSDLKIFERLEIEEHEKNMREKYPVFFTHCFLLSDIDQSLHCNSIDFLYPI